MSAERCDGRCVCGAVHYAANPCDEIKRIAKECAAALTRALAAEADAEWLRGVVEAAKEWLVAYDTFRDALEEGARPNGDQSLGGNDFDAFNARVVRALATLRSALAAAGER